MKHIISVLVENHFGVLARVSGLFSSRGFNIDSLAVGETDDSTISRITVAAEGDLKVLDQIIKQLNKLVDVIKVQDLTPEQHVNRELVLLKIHCNQKDRSEMMQVIATFRAKVIDVKAGLAIIEATGSEGKVDALIELLKPFDIVEVVRTGLIAISRESAVVYDGKSKKSGSKKKQLARK